MGHLLEDAVRLSGVMSATSSNEEVSLVCEHGLYLVVAQIRQVDRTQERVTAAVQSHLAVHLTTQQHPNADNSRVDLSSAEVIRCERQFRTLPVIAAARLVDNARLTLNLYDFLLVFYSDIRSS